MSNLTLSAILTIIDEASKPLKAIQNYSESSSDSITDLNQSIKQLNQTLNGSDGQRYNQSLKQTEKNTNAARSATRVLVTEYGHVDRALSNLLHKTDQWNTKLAQSRQNMRQEFKSIAIGGAVAGAGIYQFFKPAIDFEKQVSGVQAVLDLDKASAAMKQLEADARKWGAASSFSPTEAAQAQFALGSGGFNVDQIRQALGGTLQLAEAGKVELEQAAQIAVGTLNGFGLAAKEINRVNDVFVQATNATATSVGGLGETMKYVAPVAKQYGASIEQVTAMTGLLGNNNILDTQAGTALRGIMLRLAAPPKAAQKALDDLGVKTADAKGNLRDLSDVMNDLRITTSKMGSEERLALLSDISGTEAASAMAVLVDQTGVVDEKTGKVVNKIKQLTDELENSKGAAAQAAAILKDNLAGDIENMGGEWQDLSIAIQKVLGNDLRAFIQQVSEIIGRIKAWVEANPELVRTLANIAIKLLMLKVGLLGAKYTANLFLGSIVSIIAGITKFAIVMWIAHKIANKFGIGLPSRFTVITKTLQLLSRAFTFLARQAIPLVITGLRALAIAAMTNPLTWIITGIMAVAFVIYRYWGPIKAFFQGFWSGLMIGLAPFKDSIRSMFTALQTVLAPLKPLWEGLVAIWTIFKGVIAEALGPFQATNQELANATSYGSSLGQIFGSVIGVIGEMILIFVKLAMTILVNVGTAIGEFFGWLSLIPERASAAFNALKTYVKEAGTAFINFLLTPLRLVIDAVNILISGLNKIPSINIPKIPQVPTFAAPTVTTPTKTVTPTKAIPFPSRTAPTTNHFMGAQISITGVSDPNQVAMLVDQKLRQHQSAISAQQQRTYNDRD
ncbi:phage tail tape measure protein, TP901 family, core region [Acinetobacter sp. ANC 3929]|uniref:phage tail tape measure protein n=1 Tax=Acinetobacter sp. ANC 3929 TaxID=1217707 RepID=UPI0002CE3320|nr:phage tail tape measure protein [Acinetobacter sp. ANC 3929]ENW82688.1 phage tail tape measure protein, TP901 family, core region [Acinetobacter sp. ANC 3929]